MLIKEVVPQPFDKDGVSWRKWKDELELTMYFGGDTVGMKLAMDKVSTWKISVTSDSISGNCRFGRPRYLG